MKKALWVLSAVLAIVAGTGAVWADAADGAAQGGLSSFLPMIGYLLIFGLIMYFFIFLPQRRKDKKAKELMNSLQVGYRITTHSGIVGKIVNIRDDVVTVESGVERTQLDLKKWAIRDVDKPLEA